MFGRFAAYFKSHALDGTGVVYKDTRIEIISSALSLSNLIISSVVSLSQPLLKEQ